MTNDRNWKQTLTEYIREGEPDQATKSEAWQIAIGLQQVDRLETSDYLLCTAREHIEGRIDIHQAQCRIASYYEAEAQRKAVEDGTAEADIVSSRITELLCEKPFSFRQRLCRPFIDACLKVCLTMQDSFVCIISQKKNGCSMGHR